MRLEEGEEEAQTNNSILKTDDLDAMADMESDQESEVEQPIYSEGVLGRTFGPWEISVTRAASKRLYLFLLLSTLLHHSLLGTPRSWHQRSTSLSSFSLHSSTFSIISLTFLPASVRSLSLKPCHTECMRSMTANSWLGNQVMIGLPPVA